MPFTSRKYPPTTRGQLLTRAAVADRLQISTRQLSRVIRSGQFPTAVAISDRCLRWRPSDVDAYVDRTLGVD